MRTQVLILCLVAALGGCSILKKHDASVCDGKHRRPANSNGSVLDGAPPRPDQLSAAPIFYASCA